VVPRAPRSGSLSQRPAVLTASKMREKLGSRRSRASPFLEDVKNVQRDNDDDGHA
jgi:hypothetical protein